MTRVPVARSLLLAAALTACNPSTAHERSPAGVAPRKATLDRPSLPLAGLTAAELDRFRQGDALFEATVRESDGLGPLYVRDACSACHVDDGRGPGLVTKVALTEHSAELARQLLPYGTTERPYTSAGAKTPLLAAQDERLSVTPRLPPAVFGRGHMEAVPDAEILRLAERASRRAGSARGRLHRLASGAIGRFGLKARLATLHDFTADALSSDMGLTSPSRPLEPAGPDGLLDDRKAGIDFSAEQVALLTDYVRTLEVPERRGHDSAGRLLFDRALCSDCHEPTFRTDAAFPVRALAGVEVDLYTDFLLHDMGAAMADGQQEEGAGPQEFRTAPLIGLRFLPSLLHDGRAKTVAEAIAAHGAPDSEARDSVAAFRALSEAERTRLVKFVEAL